MYGKLFKGKHNITETNKETSGNGKKKNSTDVTDEKPSGA